MQNKYRLSNESYPEINIKLMIKRIFMIIILKIRN